MTWGAARRRASGRRRSNLARLKLGAVGDNEDAFSGSSRTFTLEGVACGRTLETG